MKRIGRIKSSSRRW